MATDFQYKIKAIDAKPHPMTGNKQYEYLLMIDYADGGTAMERSGVFSSKQAANDAINIMIAKHKSSVEDRPVTIKTNYGTETQEVNANQSYALEKEKEALDQSLRDLTEDPSNPGYTVSGRQLVDQDTYSSQLGATKKQYATPDPAKLEATKNRYSEINSVLRSQAPNASVINRTRQRLEQEGLTVGAIQTGATTPTEDGQFGGTGVGTGTTYDTTTGGGTTYVGDSTDEGGTPVATDPTGTGTGTGTIGGGTTYGQQPITGTFGTPLQTSGLSAVPTFNYNQPVQQQAGFTQQQLTSTMPGMGGAPTGVQTVQYTNQYGQSIPVTESNGQPITYVPPGYTKTTGAAQGGLMRRGYAGGGLTVQQNEDGTSAITLNGETIRTYRAGHSPSVIQDETKRLQESLNKVQDYLATNATPPQNVVDAFYNSTNPGVSRSIFTRMFGKLQENAINKRMAEEAKKYEKTYGVQTNAERYADREGYGQITESPSGGFQLNLPGNRPTFATREAAQAYLSGFNQLVNEGSAQAYIAKQQKADGFFKRTPQPEATDEYNAKKQAALESFRALQDLRDYEGGPLSPELIKKRAILRTGANTATLDPQLLKDQDFLRQLKGMGVDKLVSGGMGPTGLPEFSELRINSEGTGPNGQELLSVKTMSSGMGWNDLTIRDNLGGTIRGNVFLDSDRMDPSVFKNKIASSADIASANRLGKPEASEFAAITGRSLNESLKALGGNFASGDIRNWGAILQAGDPYQAAIDAQKQLYYRYTPQDSRAENTGADQYIHQIPQTWDEIIRNYSTATPEQKELLLRGDIVRFKDVNTGEMREEVLKKPSERTNTTRLDRYKDLMRIGAIDEFDIKDFENLPNYPDAFREEYGRDPTVEDFADYGYTDPEGSFKNIMGDQTQDTTTIDDQTDELFPPSEPDEPVTQPTTPYGTTYGQQPITTSTTGTTLQTAGLSAVPTFNYNQPVQQQAGFTPQQLTSTMPGMGGGSIGVQTVQYTNEFGQTISVTENNGQPITYVPPGYKKTTAAAQGGMMRNGYAEGGTVDKAILKIAQMNGFQGSTPEQARLFMNSSEGLRAKARAIGAMMNKGGAVLYAQEGVDVQPGTSTDPSFATQLAGQTKDLIGQTMTPQQSTVNYIQPTTEDFIPTGAGQVGETAPYAEAATVGTVQQAGIPTVTGANTMTPTMVTPGVQGVTSGMQPVTGTVSDQAQVTAAQQETSAVSDLKAQQGTAIIMDNPVQREIQDGELISGAANAQKAAEFTEQIEAATAEPSAKATVQGQLEGLMQQFEGGNTPAWAAGSMRAAMANLSARGLGASSLAGQAVIQAAMEAALPIAQMDAQTTAQFEAQNLSNRQQRAMLAAQQRAQFLGMEFDQAFQARVQNSARIGDIANMNFTAEQNIALENSRAANTMNLQNLSNSQAMVMAEAAALANLDMANLSNRQQAAVQNAQNFLQMDMTNLGFEQQTAMFKAQQNIQALFTDQAAENAAAQFNASSENQTNQFFANLSAQTSQFNAAQQNAMDQFNVNSINALREFNSEMQNQRDMFNAQNGLVVAQANAQWRQNIATLNTAAQNESNMNFAKTMNAFTSTNLDAYWQRERDIMSFAFTSAENAAARMSEVLLAEMNAEAKAKYADAQGRGILGATLLKGALNYMAGGKIV